MKFLLILICILLALKKYEFGSPRGGVILVFTCSGPHAKNNNVCTHERPVTMKTGGFTSIKLGGSKLKILHKTHKIWGGGHLWPTHRAPMYVQYSLLC